MPYPASPGPPCFFTGEPPRARLYPYGAGKRQDTIPRTARCRSVSLERVYTSTRAIAPGFQPSRGGSVVAPPPQSVPDMQDCVEHTLAPSLHLLAFSSTAGLSRRWIFQVTVPRGVHPIGGRNGDPMEAQRSGFHWERTSDEMSEPCPCRARRRI